MPTTTPLFTEEFLKDFLKTYSKDEQELIQEDLAALLHYSFFKRAPATSKPIYLATAGGPGACKSTVLETYLRTNGLQDGVYTDPDQVALRKMNYTYKDWVTNYDYAKAKDYKEALTIAYEKWRWASNYIAHSVLQEAFLKRYNIAHGTTSTSPHIVKLYEKLKPDYSIELLLCYAPDDIRREAVQTRERQQAFVQADPNDVISKGKEFHKRFPIYFQYADKITFYWQNDLQNGQLPEPAAEWDRTTNQILVHNNSHWQHFCAQYHADLKASSTEIPENLAMLFGSGNIAINQASNTMSANNNVGKPVLTSFTMTTTASTNTSTQQRTVPTKTMPSTPG